MGGRESCTLVGDAGVNRIPDPFTNVPVRSTITCVGVDAVTQNVPSAATGTIAMLAAAVDGTVGVSSRVRPLTAAAAQDPIVAHPLVLAPTVVRFTTTAAAPAGALRRSTPVDESGVPHAEVASTGSVRHCRVSTSQIGRAHV